ncbi:unnamed protein product, partial [Polarella glacialis]
MQRLNQLRRSVPYVSQSALAAILLDVKEKGVPELHQRKAMQEATSCELAKLDAYGPLIQTVNGILKSGDTLSGMNLVLPGGERLRIWFRSGMFLQDGAAHKYVLGIKGDSGSKFCMLCKNDFKIKQDDDDSEEDVPFTALKHKDMLLASDEEVLSSVDRLASRKGTCSKAIFAMRGRACGFDQPNGLLLCKELRDAGLKAWSLLAEWIDLYKLPECFSKNYL